MNYIPPRTLKWRGQYFQVSCTTTPGRESAEVSPPNPELHAAVIASLKRTPGMPLSVYRGCDSEYLMDDPRRGEA